MTPDFTTPAMQELSALEQWVCWKRVWRGNEPTKKPFMTDGFSASATDPTTWTTFAGVRRAVPTLGTDKGIGFVLGAPYSGIDVDSCREPNSGAIADWGMAIITALNSYAEISPSGTGVKIIARGTLPTPGRKTALKTVTPMVSWKSAAIEMYSAKRYFAITGLPVSNTRITIEPAQGALDALYTRFFGTVTDMSAEMSTGTTTTVLPSAGLEDEAVLEHARAAANGHRFRRLFDVGDISLYGSASEADAGLCALLLFWCGDDLEQVDRLFRRSALCRSKWTDRADYRERTIAFAASGKTDVYQRPDEIRRPLSERRARPVATGPSLSEQVIS
jgi:primase-polymerase (primpol)-like protein